MFVWIIMFTSLYTVAPTPLNGCPAGDCKHDYGTKKECIEVANTVKRYGEIDFPAYDVKVWCEEVIKTILENQYGTAQVNHDK